MLTAENPLGIAVSAAENNSLMKKLCRLLKDGHYVYRKIKGKFASNVEHSVLICNVALDEAKSLAARFSQEAFVYGIKKHPATVGKSDRGPMVMFTYYGIDKGMKFAKTQKIVDAGGSEHIVGVIDPAMYKAQTANDRLDPEASGREDDFSVRKNFKFAVSFNDFNFWLKDMENEYEAYGIPAEEVKESAEPYRAGQWRYVKRRSMARKLQWTKIRCSRIIYLKSMGNEQIRYWAELARQFANGQEPLLEMARVGYFFRDQYEVYVHTDDPGNIPHFHIRDSATRGNAFHTCVKILEPTYFHHTGKEDVLNSAQKKALVQFLAEAPAKKNRKAVFSSNWEKLVYEWNENNSESEVPEDLPIPDYAKL